MEKTDTTTKAEKKVATKAIAAVAIIEINGNQYLAKKGQTINVSLLINVKKEAVTPKVMAIITETTAEYGKPYLENKVDFDLGEMIKLKKVTTNRFQAKSRLRKRVGMRPKLVQVTINEF